MLETVKALDRRVSTTDFGAKVMGAGKLARYNELHRDSCIKKAAATSIVGFALTFPLAMITFCGVKLFWSTTISSLLKTVGLACLAFCSLLTLKALKSKFHEYSSARKHQLQERQIINVLGGPTVFKSIPLLLPHQFEVTQGSLTIKSNDVGFHPTMRGVDSLNQPFVIFCVKNKKTNTQSFLGIFKLHQNPNKRRSNSKINRPSDKLLAIQKLIQGTHPHLTLVPKPEIA